MPTSISDRNLLFGIVALQMDFINRDQLVTAMHDWVLMKSKPLGRLLVERESLTDDTCTLLESLVEKHLAHHNHDVTKSLAAVGSSSFRDDFIAFDDPDVQATLAHLPNSADDAEMHAEITLVVGEDSSDGQRFRRLRPHAKGGLGEVWVAEDLELHREVALKEIQPRVADNADSRARFVMEAEITGGLEHPGIVPVYGLGKHADGRPYYAMRFIRGTDLKEEIGRFHARDNAAEGKWRDLGERTLELRKLLDRFIDVCNAIEYAHSRGVIHRDIKPSNIMLGKYGETLVVDWGLAKPVGKLASHTDTDERTIEPTSGSGSSETQMGSAVGTPQFMAPEQAAGRVDKMGRASDVYSLGATLFDLLAGQPPFTEGNVPTILRNVQDGKFPRPRQVKSLVPRPLEAVCLKAMALRIEDRYDSARGLADDVERYLADEPVSAYTEPLLARVYRWVRNHRVRVAISTGVLVAILASVIAAALVIRAQNETQEIAQRQQKETRRAALEDEKTAASLTGQNDFGSAEQVLRKALERLGKDVSFRKLHKRLSDKRDRAQRLNQFSLLIENAWRFHFHEYDDDAIVACDKALRQLCVFDQKRWWEHLPDDELTELQADQLREQAHAALLLYATEVAKYTLPEAGLLDFARSLFGQGNSDLYRISLHLCQLAQAFHPTQVGSLLDVYCRFGVGEISPATLPEELLELTINAPAPKCALDHHFLGGAHFLLAADPTSPLSGAIRFLNKRVNLGIDTENAKFTARRLLLAATRLSSRPYWSYLTLGLTLMNSGEPHNAELVYNTCITLEPDQPEGYLERARAIMEQTVKYPLAAQTDLPRRALEDLDRALELRPLLPAVRRTRADLFARFRQLGRRSEAIAEYTRWLELIRPIYMYRGRTSQRGLIRGCQQIKEFCQTLVNDGEEVVAARELLALAQLAQRDFRGARKTISRMNEADTQRATVLRIRGSLKLKQATRGNVPDRGLLRQSLKDFDAALRLTPDRYQLRIGRVRVLLRLEKNTESLQALDEMLKRNIAQTDWQEYEINAQRLRVLHSLGRSVDAQQALHRAREMNPIAAAGLAEWFNADRPR